MVMLPRYTATSVSGVELVWVLFEEYLLSPTFKGDLAESLSDYTTLSAFFQSGFKFSALSHSISKVLSYRLLTRITECAVTAVCVHGPPFLQDAVVFHYLYPIVQQYRFSRCWATRLLRGLVSFVVPRFMRRSGSGTSPEADFLRAPPAPQLRPGDHDVFESMPTYVQDAMRFYHCQYQGSTLRAILSAGLIPDMSRLLVDQLIWVIVYMEERKKRTSLARFVKRYIGDTAITFAEMGLSCAVRLVGASCGKRFSSEPTSAHVFWCEHLLLLGCSMQITYLSFLIGQFVYDALDYAHPATTEDAAEDQREQEEQQEAHERAEKWARMAQSAGAAASGQGGGDGAGIPLSSSSGLPNYYEVLGVGENAKAPDIKKAYRQMALQNHPDRVGRENAAVQEAARTRMVVINEAYDTLLDDNKRAQYDATRMLMGSPQILESLENMTAPKLLALCAGVSVGLGLMMYVQVTATYMRITSTGRGPLTLFR